MEKWSTDKLDSTITKAFNRLKSIICNILEEEGGHKLIESKRGKKFENIKVEDVI